MPGVPAAEFADADCITGGHGCQLEYFAELWSLPERPQANLAGTGSTRWSMGYSKGKVAMLEAGSGDLLDADVEALPSRSRPDSRSGARAVIQMLTMQPFDGAGHYVEGALRLLQYVEARRPTGRRFGADADAPPPRSRPRCFRRRPRCCSRNPASSIAISSSICCEALSRPPRTTRPSRSCCSCPATSAACRRSATAILADLRQPRTSAIRPMRIVACGACGLFEPLP